MAFVKSIPEAEESVATVMRRYTAQAIALTELTNIIMGSGDCAFTAEQRELIAAYSSSLNDCTYCYNTHKATAEAFGVDEEYRVFLCNFFEFFQEDPKSSSWLI